MLFHETKAPKCLSHSAFYAINPRLWGGGGDDKSNDNSSTTPPPAPVVTNKVIGKWIDYFPENDCKEVHEYKADMTFIVRGNKADIRGTYEVGALSSNGSQTVTLKFTQYNGGADCDNQTTNIVGQTAELRATYPEYKLILSNPSTNETIFELNKAVSLTTTSTNETLKANETLSLKLISNSDRLINPKIIESPSETTWTENGELTWIAPESFFSKQNDYQFKLTAENTIDTYSAQVKVTDENAGLPIANPFSLDKDESHEPIFADFDGDGKNELLLTKGNVISLVEVTHDGYKHKWSYPYTFDGTPNLYVQAADINNDGKTDIIIREGEDLYQITDLNRKAEKIFTSKHKAIDKFKIIDLNSDNSPEIIFNTDEASNPNFIGIYDLNKQQLIRQIKSQPSEIFEGFNIGNVDDDPQLEIVTDNGYVIDTKTYNQYRIFEKKTFLNPMLVSLGNKNYKMIVPRNSRTLEFWDAPTKSKLFEYTFSENNGLCGVVLTNLTNDKTDEIVAQECVDDSNIIMHTLDWQNDKFTISNSFTLPKPSTFDDLAYQFVGDIGQDNILDIVNVRDKSIIVAPVNGDQHNRYSRAYDNRYYMNLGWGEVTPGVFKNVGITSGSWFDEYYLTHQDVTSNSIKQFTLENRFRPNIDKTKLSDIEGDGNSEIILIDESGSRDKYLKLISASTAEELLKISIGDQFVRFLKVYDIDNDGNQEALLFYEDKLKVVNLKTSVIYDITGDFNSSAYREVKFEVFSTPKNRTNILQYSSSRSSINVKAKVFSLSPSFTSTLLAEEKSALSCRDIAVDPKSNKLYCYHRRVSDYTKIIELSADLEQIESVRVSEQCSSFDQMLVHGKRAFLGNHSICGVSVDTGQLQWQSPRVNGLIENGFHFIPKGEHNVRDRFSFATRNGLFLTR